jgi:NAD+ diphosphatase
VTAPGFTGSSLDRADALREDSTALETARADPRAKLLRLDGLEPEIDGDGRLLWDDLSAAPAGAELVLLGLEAGEPRFAAWHPDAPPGARSPALFHKLGLMPFGEASTYAGARSVLDWLTRHRFCANCGRPAEIFRAGWGRKCPSCGAQHFPRTDPVVIMVAEHRGRALLGRQPMFPPGRYSALAGYLEPGESIEEAVAREIREEAGIRVRDVRYVASQPWPFPSALMIACVARAENDDIRIDSRELEDAMWVDREGVRRALADDPAAPFLPPPPYAIARTLLTAWAEGA